jgi:LacI family transcriptional regulator
LKTTIIDIAQCAGLSTATVDRVLNRRPGASAASRQRVYEAARKLNYLPTFDSVTLPSKPAHLAFIIPIGKNSFLAGLAKHIEDYASRIPLVASCTVHRLNSYSPEETMAAIEKISLNARGLGIIALDHPKTRDALRSLTEAGVRLVTIASDIPAAPRAAYIGIDNRIAGRTAAWIMGRMIGERHGTIAVFMGSRSYRGHEEREAGFRSVVVEDFQDLSISSVVEVAEDSRKSYTETLGVLRREKDLLGLYCIGAGGQGIVQGLREVVLRRKPVFICHDLTADTRSYLLEGVADAVIDQNARLMAEQSVIQLLGSMVSVAPFLSRALIEPRVILRENIPVQ